MVWLLDPLFLIVSSFAIVGRIEALLRSIEDRELKHRRGNYFQGPSPQDCGEEDLYTCSGFILQAFRRGLTIEFNAKMIPMGSIFAGRSDLLSYANEGF